MTTNAFDQQLPELALPYDRPRPARRSQRMERHAFTLETGAGQGQPRQRVLLAAFVALLYRYGNRSEIPVAVAGQGEMLLQASPAASQSFADLLAHVADAWPAMLAQQQAGQIGQAAVCIALLPYVASAPERFEWILEAEEHGDGRLQCALVYASERFDAATVQRLAGHLCELLMHAAQAPQTRLDQLHLLGPGEHSQLQAWNAAASGTLPAFVPLPQSLSEQARIGGERSALVQGEQRLSWRELERRANRLAHRLIAHGVGAEVRVGVGIERSPQMIIALLAVLKAGGAFVPLDPGYPAERLAYMRADAGIQHLLTQRSLVSHWTDLTGLDELDILVVEDANREWPDTPPQTAIHPAQSAYLVYTSGSTGQPKGVCVEHGPLARHCQAIAQRYQMRAQDTVLHFASINFDLAHEYWLMPLLCGAQLVVSEPALWSPAQACEQMARHGVTVAAFPPSYLVQLAEAAQARAQSAKSATPPLAPLALRVLAFGGEALSREHFEQVRQAFAPATLINGYGPTETVISPMLWTTTPASDPAQWQHSPYLPIGTAVGARSAWVLDEALNPLPVGVAGELYLGGPELARAYHQRPGLTAERFVPDPWRTGGRLYRSGDRARWRSDGGMDYLGRLDHQVKLRGQRIELGEIEAALLACAGVREAAVLLQGEGADAQLLGYWVAQQDSPQDSERLRQQLARQLPAYMLPAQLVQLPVLPLTANGKLDRRALPQSHLPSQVPGPAYEPPQTASEITLAQIWAELLKRERVGRLDHFFALGGHSLLATQVCARVRQQLSVDLPLSVIFEHPVLADMAAMLARDAGAAQQSEAQDLLDMRALLEALES